jgi:hypothetical protein
LGNFGLFRTFAQTFYLFTFCFLAFSSAWIIQKKTKAETKKSIFDVFLPENVPFCRK